MNVTTRLVLVLLALTVIFTGSTLALRHWQKRDIASILNAHEHEVSQLTDAVLGLKSQLSESFLSDYTLWDETVSFVRTNDLQWAKSNIEAVLDTYDIDAVWVYRPDFAAAYFSSSVPDRGFRDLPLPDGALKELFSNSRLAHFFFMTPLGPMEVRGTTIHPTEDTERKTPPSGYCLVGQLWDQEYLDELSNILTGKAVVVHGGLLESVPATTATDGTVLMIRRPLMAWDGTLLAELEIQSKSPLVWGLASDTARKFTLEGVFSLCLIVILSLLLVRWIGVPLRRISIALATKNVDGIRCLENNKTEFGHIARLITRHFAQTKELVNEIAERELVKEALLRETAFSHTLLENMVDGVAACDAHGDIVLFNRTLREWHGLEPFDVPQEVRAEESDLYRADGVTPIPLEEVPLTRALRGEMVRDAQVCIVRNDVPLRIAVANGGPFYDEGGRILGAVVVLRDVTARRLAEKALRESETRYRQLVESSNDWVWEMDQNNVYNYASPHIYKTLGYEPGEVIGKTPFDLMPEEEAARMKRVLAQITVRREPYHGLENIQHHKDGRLLFVETNGAPILGDDGAYLGYRGTDRDITERKQAEVALRESEARYRLLADNVNDVIWTMDLSGHFTYISPSNERQTGYTFEETMALRFDQLLTPASATVARKRLAEAVTSIKAGRPRKGGHIELDGVRKDGSVLSVEINFNSMYSPTGEFIGFLGINRDITERKRAEQERDRLIAELQKALGEVKTLSGLLPICANCKKVREDSGDWTYVESYIQKRSDAQFSHLICPECQKALYPDLYT